MKNMNILKEKLNHLATSNDLTSEEVLAASEELDLLILEYYKEKEKGKNDKE